MKPKQQPLRPNETPEVMPESVVLEVGAATFKLSSSGTRWAMMFPPTLEIFSGVQRIKDGPTLPPQYILVEDDEDLAVLKHLRDGLDRFIQGYEAAKTENEALEAAEGKA